MSSKVTVSATINADAKKAWDCYTQPEHIMGWNFADPSWHCPAASNDMRKGGKYAARMEAKDGSFGFDFEAVYDEVNDGKDFTYTMPNGRQVYASFEAQGDQTGVTISFDPEDENPVAMQQQGWQMILDNFKRYTEAQ